MTSLVCLIEEPSAAEMLKGVLPRLLPEITTTFITFEGKQDLEKRFVKRIKFWQDPKAVFLVMRDQDSGNCKTIKKRLMKMVQETGKADRVLIRIACRELESFYLGDLAAVEAGLEIKGLKKLQKKEKFRDPDHLENPSNILNSLTAGYYQKVSGSEAIAPFMDLEPEINRSVSFQVLLSGLKRLCKSV